MNIGSINRPSNFLLKFNIGLQLLPHSFFENLPKNFFAFENLLLHTSNLTFLQVIYIVALARELSYYNTLIIIQRCNTFLVCGSGNLRKILTMYCTLCTKDWSILNDNTQE